MPSRLYQLSETCLRCVRVPVGVEETREEREKKKREGEGETERERERERERESARERARERAGEAQETTLLGNAVLECFDHHLEEERLLVSSLTYLREREREREVLSLLALLVQKYKF
jgi:hypothetical protein